ncbi:MAG TPA: haloacid dehalogenase [Acidimicrobiia bacterium]
MTPDLEPLRLAVTEVFDDKYRARERGLANCRRVIRASANAIRALHRGQTAEAEVLMDEAGTLLREAVGVLAPHPDVGNAGFIHDAAKEYAEARLTAALGLGAPTPLPKDLGVEPAAYLNGLGEAVGELRRRMLDLLRAGELTPAESILEAMDAVVEFLATIDYPDGMTGGLRRTTDVARALVERSRSDLTTTVVQERLRKELQGR